MSNSGSSNNSSNSKASNNKNQSKNNVKQGNNNSRNLKQQQVGNRFKRTSPTTKNNAESNNEQPKKEQKRREKEEEIARASHNSSKSKRQRAGKNNKRTVEMNHNNSVGDKQQDNEQGTGIVGVGHNDSESNEQQVIGKGKRKAGVSHNNLENDKQQAIGKGKRNIGVGHNNLASDKQQAKESGKSKSGAGKDNSGSNKLQQAGEKVGKTADEVQSTTKGVKDTASLVTNATTGNIPGAAVDAVKVITNKKFMKKVAFIIMLPIIIILAIILLLLLFLYMIITDLGGRVQEIADTSQDTSEYATVRESDGAILISDDQIDKLIAAIEESGVDLDAAWLMGDLESDSFPTEEDYQIAKRKYIRKFYEAQLVTETLNYFHTESTDTMTYGAIYLYRLVEDEDTGATTIIDLTYIPYDEMIALQADGDVTALEHFTIDGVGNLVVAGSIQTIVEEGSSVDSLSEVSDVTEITLSVVDYRAAVSQYVTKMNFLVYLTMISQNPEFVSALTDLIKDTRIEITIMDNITTTVNTETYQYIVHRRIRDVEITDEGVETSEYRVSQEVVTEVTRETVIEKRPAFNPTYIQTWFCKQSIEYNKNTEYTDETYPIDINPRDDPDPGTSGTWITGRSKHVQVQITTETWDEGTRDAVEIIVGERGDGQRYQNGDIDTPTFIGLMETPFRIPNTTKEERPAGNLLSGAEWLFELMQQDSGLENMEIIMRYAFYIYEDDESWIRGLDLNFDELFSIPSLSPVISGGGSGGHWGGSGGSYGSTAGKEFTKSWENNALRKYMNGEQGYTGRYVVNYITQDNTKFICYTDVNNTRNYAFGICHYTGGAAGGTANNHIDKYAALGIDITAPEYNQIGTSLMDVDIVMTIFDQVYNEYRNEVLSKKDQYAPGSPSLTEGQLVCLTDMRYQGSIRWPDFFPIYASQDENAIRNYILDHSSSDRGEARWKAYSEGVFTSPEGEVLGTGIGTGSGGGIGTGNYGSEVLEVARNVWREVCSRFTTYGSMHSIPPSANARTIDCSAYITWVLYELGYKDFNRQYDTRSFYSTNWNAKYGWTEISVRSGENPVDILQPGDIFVRYEGKNAGETHHILIVDRIENGRLYAYDCGSVSNWRNSGGNSVDKTYFLTESGPGKIIRIN